jgi:hypothetical protein
MSQGAKNCPLLAAMDGTGVRVTNNFGYRGRPFFRTAVGGIFSTIAYVGILTTAVFMFDRMFGPPRYYQTELFTYISGQK